MSKESSVVAVDGDFVIRRMRDEDHDYALMVKWRNEPHVLRWWDYDMPRLTMELAKEEYQPDTIPGAPSTACIIELGGAPIGFIQFYLWSSYAEHAEKVGIPFGDRTYSLDVFIGEPDKVGKGVGTRVVDLLCGYLLGELGGSGVTLTTDVENHQAQRCYEKAGFNKIKQVLDSDTYKGERTLSWVMTRTAAPDPES